MGRITTFTNSGSLTATNLNMIQDDYENLYSTYRNIFNRAGAASGSALSTGVTYLPSYRPDGDLDAIGSGGSGLTEISKFRPILPTDYNSPYRTPQFRIAGSFFVNSVAPAASFSIHLYQALTINSSNLIASSTLIGASVGIITPGANSITNFASSPFVFATTALSGGYFNIGVRTTANNAATSRVGINAYLQYNRV